MKKIYIKPETEVVAFRLNASTLYNPYGTGGESFPSASDGTTVITPGGTYEADSRTFIMSTNGNISGSFSRSNLWE